MSENIGTLCGQFASLYFENGAAISICIFLALEFIIAPLTIFGNFVFMLTVAKTKSLHTPSNVLLVGLCCSDLLIGCVGHPVTMSFLLLIKIKGVVNYDLMTACYQILYLCGGLSFTYTVLVSLDRYVAICHPYRYHGSATCKTHLFATISLGLFWCIFNILEYYYRWNTIFEIMRLVEALLSVVTISFCYFKIYRVIRKQIKAIASVGEITDDTDEKTVELTRQKQERDKAYTIAVIIGFFFLCYIPYICLYVYYFSRSGFCWDTKPVLITSMWVYFAMLLNSLINPIVYYAKRNEIRKAVKKLFSRKTSEFR